jgi:beta-lactam-binding protein with PASTA domain
VRRFLIALVVVALIAGAFGSGYYFGSHGDDRRVPNLLGLGTGDGGQAAARHELAGHGLRVGKVGWMVCTADEIGLVVFQNPPAGAIVPRGATINIAIGSWGRLFDNPQPCLPGEQQPAGQSS